MRGCGAAANGRPWGVGVEFRGLLLRCIARSPPPRLADADLVPACPACRTLLGAERAQEEEVQPAPPAEAEALPVEEELDIFAAEEEEAPQEEEQAPAEAEAEAEPEAAAAQDVEAPLAEEGRVEEQVFEEEEEAAQEEVAQQHYGMAGIPGGLRALPCCCRAAACMPWHDASFARGLMAAHPPLLPWCRRGGGGGPGGRAGGRGAAGRGGQAPLNCGRHAQQSIWPPAPAPDAAVTCCPAGL